jgi:hypothetical protein
MSLKLGKLFTDEIDSLSMECYQKRLMQSAVSLSAVLSLGCAVLAPTQPKHQIGWQLFLSSSLGFLSAAMNESRKDVESRFKVFKDANHTQYKEEVKNSFKVSLAQTEVVGELKLAQFIRSLPVTAQERYKLKFALDGLGVGAQDVPLVKEDSQSSQISGKANNVASPNVDIQNQVVDRKADAIIQNLSNQYPNLLKVNGDWVNELIQSSTNMNMSKRLNHHYYLCGETQSGKSTLAGVLADGIAAMSQSPATIAIHDAKKEDGGMDITNWMCGWTYKLDGLNKVSAWFDLAQKLSKKQTEEVSKVGNSCEGVGELILIQDEVDTIYGKGKGFGEIIPKKLADKIQTLWMYSVKFLAGLKGHMIFMGQSPLSEDTGFNRPSLANLCFICLNQTTDYILNNPKDFLKHMSEEEIELLKQFCKLFEDMGVRYALVRPMKGSAYVALIPNFTKKENSEVKVEESLDNQGETEEIVNIEDVPQDKEDSPKITEDQQIYKALIDWCLTIFQEYEEFPTLQQICEAYKTVAEKELDEKIAETILEIAKRTKS